MPETLNIPKIGPVKTNYVVAAVAVAGTYVGYRWWKSRTTEPVVVDPSSGSSDFVNPNPQIPTDDISTVTNPNVGDQPTTNAEWTTKAIADMQNIGFEPGFVATTLGKYLSGESLTVAEAALVRAAIAMEGEPPDGALPIRVGVITNPVPPSPAPKPTPKPAPKPAPKPTPKPPTQRTYTVKTGDSLSRIALLYYGHGSKPYYDRIYNANRSTIEAAARAHHHANSHSGDLIFPGTVLVIPR
jgi:LysM domain.